MLPGPGPRSDDPVRMLRAAPLLIFSALSLACDHLSALDSEHGDSLSKRNRTQLVVGERMPNVPEATVVGAADAPIARTSIGFKTLIECEDCPIVFKDEERNKSDRFMTPKLRRSLVQLSKLVSQTWPKVELRVTEAWDDRREHGPGSLHYEGRAADITTSDQDPAKLGTLAALAVKAGFDWVYFEDATHVHVSVKR